MRGFGRGGWRRTASRFARWVVGDAPVSSGDIPVVVTSPTGLMGNIGGENFVWFIQPTATVVGSDVQIYLRMVNRITEPQTDRTADVRLVIDGVPNSVTTPILTTVQGTLGGTSYYGVATLPAPSDGVHSIELYIVSAASQMLRCEANYFVVGSAPASLPSYQVPALGNATQSNRWRNGWVDYVTWPGGNTRPVSNSVASRSVVTTMGITSAGVTAIDYIGSNRWYQTYTNHVPVGLYMSEPDWRIVNRGWVGIEQFLWQGGDSATAALPGQKKKPIYNGTRQRNTISGYSTLRFTSTLKAWVISISGELAWIDMATGEKQAVAGRVYKTSTVALSENVYTDAQISAANFELVGTAASAGMLDWSAPHDAYPLPSDENKVIVADSFNHRIYEVDTNVVPAAVSMLVGYNGKGCADGDVLVSAKINRPYAFWIHPDDERIFFCCTPVSGEEADSAIFELSQDRSSLRKVVGYGTSAGDPSATFRPFWMCEFTSGQVLSYEHVTGVVKQHDYETGDTSVLISGATALPDGWVQVVCDTHGTIGPRYDVFLVPANSSPGNISIKRYSVSGTYRNDWLLGSNGVAPTGSTDVSFEPHGHYPWFFDIHRRYALAATQGFGNTGPNVVRLKVSADKPRTYQHATYGNGQFIMQHGTLPGFPVVARPSFTCLRNAFGQSWFPGIPSWSECIETMTEASIKSYLAAGAGGVVPRPEISGYWADLALYAMKYMADADVTVSPPSTPNNVFPSITSWSQSRSGSALSVSFTTTKAVIPCLSDFYKATIGTAYATSHTIDLADCASPWVVRMADADGHVIQTVSVAA
jgi:hypothetical protein